MQKDISTTEKQRNNQKILIVYSCYVLGGLCGCALISQDILGAMAGGVIGTAISFAGIKIADYERNK